jgi:putative ABC transport system ATP-binding protein
MPVLDATDLRKMYVSGEVSTEVLRGVDVSIGPGEFVALLGPSGSGKSTLLHILGLMDRPSSGTLHFQGQDVADLKRSEMADLRRTELGFVFQTFNLLPTLDALENVGLPMRLSGVASARRRQRATCLLGEMGLGDRLRHHPSQLSGGERQRVAIARSLANEPKLLLVDEPTGNLDSEATRVVMEIFAGIHQRGGTILVVTHNPEVSSYAQRVLHMRDGRLSEAESGSAVPDSSVSVAAPSVLLGASAAGISRITS